MSILVILLYVCMLSAPSHSIHVAAWMAIVILILVMRAPLDPLHAPIATSTKAAPTTLHCMRVRPLLSRASKLWLVV